MAITSHERDEAALFEDQQFLRHGVEEIDLEDGDDAQVGETALSSGRKPSKLNEHRCLRP